MTDRINALTVTLDRDIRDDDVEPIADAIRMLRGVLRVDLHVTDINSHVAESRAEEAWRKKLYDLLAID